MWALVFFSLRLWVFVCTPLKAAAHAGFVYSPHQIISCVFPDSGSTTQVKKAQQILFGLNRKPTTHKTWLKERFYFRDMRYKKPGAWLRPNFVKCFCDSAALGEFGPIS